MAAKTGASKRMKPELNEPVCAGVSPTPHDVEHGVAFGELVERGARLIEQGQEGDRN